MRLYLDYNVWEIYRGRQFFPLFLKELHLLAACRSLDSGAIAM